MAVTIMLIDHDPQFLSSTKSTVETLGWCELRTMSDSREALRCLEQRKFDGVVMNVAMRSLDGFELTKRVRASPLNAGVPIVMLTADDDVDTMRQGFKLGVTFFMVKPFTRERVHKLFAAVRGVMTCEKRRHVRLPYRTKVMCEWGPHGEHHFTSESQEISEGGMSLTPSGGVEAGQQVVLEFLLPMMSKAEKVPPKKPRRQIFPESEGTASGPQKIRAIVRYRTPQDVIGLEFVNLQPAQRQAIQRYITGVF